MEVTVQVLALVRGGGFLLILAVALSAVALAASPPAAGGEAGYGCGAGLDLGALTLSQGLAPPRNQAGLTARVDDLRGLPAPVYKSGCQRAPALPALEKG